MPKQPDARPLQKQLLIFENRGLKPMAKTLLSKAPKQEKLLAIAAASAMLVALNSAPEEFYSTVAKSIPDASPENVSGAIALASDELDNLSTKINASADNIEIIAGLERLFHLADTTHLSLEKQANSVGAKLIKRDNSKPLAVDPGHDDEKTQLLVIWLKAVVGR